MTVDPTGACVALDVNEIECDPVDAAADGAATTNDKNATTNAIGTTSSHRNVLCDEPFRMDATRYVCLLVARLRESQRNNREDDCADAEVSRPSGARMTAVIALGQGDAFRRAMPPLRPKP